MKATFSTPLSQAKTNLLNFSKLELSQKHPFEVEQVTTLVPGLSPARLLGCSTFLKSVSPSEG